MLRKDVTFVLKTDINVYLLYLYIHVPRGDYFGYNNLIMFRLIG